MSIPCRKCGQPTAMLATKLCDGCWEIEARVPDIDSLRCVKLSDDGLMVWAHFHVPGGTAHFSICLDTQKLTMARRFADEYRAFITR